MSRFIDDPFLDEEKRTIARRVERFGDEQAFLLALGHRLVRPDDDPEVVNESIRKLLTERLSLSDAQADEAIGRAIIRMRSDLGEDGTEEKSDG